MSFEETLESIVRKVVREELQSLSGDDQLLTTEQVAELLVYSTHTVYQLKREKKLKAVVLGDNSLRFKRADVRRFIEERAQ
jgi:excisionase family DNA binding protein